MSEDLEFILEETRDSMKKALDHLETELKSRGLGFGGFAVGIDTEFCMRLLDLLSFTRNAETTRLLGELKSKYARHALGRRAADILSAQA